MVGYSFIPSVLIQSFTLHKTSKKYIRSHTNILDEREYAYILVVIILINPTVVMGF